MSAASSASVKGVWAKRVDARVEREPRHPGSFDVGDDGKPAGVRAGHDGGERLGVEDGAGVGVQ